MHCHGIAICSSNICMFFPVISSVSMHVSIRILIIPRQGCIQSFSDAGCPWLRQSAVDLTVKSVWTQRVCGAESRSFPKVNEPIVNQITSCDQPAMIGDLHTYRQRERESWGRVCRKMWVEYQCVSHTHIHAQKKLHIQDLGKPMWSFKSRPLKNTHCFF